MLRNICYKKSKHCSIKLKEPLLYRFQYYTTESLMCRFNITSKGALMYHIKKDSRSKKTAETLCQTLFILLKNKPLSELTVSDFYNHCGIARSTFYRLFDTPEDILFYLCDQFKENASQEFNDCNISDLRQMSIASINLSMKHHELLEILIQNHRQDLLNQLFEANFQNIRVHFPVLEKFDDVTKEYIHTLLYTSMTALHTTWLIRGQKENPEQLYLYLKEYGQVLEQLSLTDSNK